MRCDALAVVFLISASLLPAAGPLQITTASVPTSAVSGTPFSYTWTATGGTTPYHWSIATGTLPTGLTLSDAALLSGTPTALGTFSFTVRVADSGGLSADYAAKMTIVPPPLVITSAPLNSGTLNFPVSLQLAGAGGVPPYMWKLSSGTLPPGLFLTPSALLSGVWTTPGTYNFSFTLTDSAGSSATQTESVTIAPATVLPAGVVGKAYSASVPSGATLASGTIGVPPPGILISSSGLAGIPTTAGTYVFSLGTTTYSISVTAPLAPSTTNPPDGQVGTPYSGSLPVNGGIAPYTWSLTSGSLPTGLSLVASGQITGTPTLATSTTFTATVTDATGATAVSSFTLQVDGAALEAQALRATAATGIFFSAALTATGGTPPYTWSAAGLPPGTILYNGTIVGTPGASDANTFYGFATQVTDAAGATASGTAIISVVNPVALPDGLVGSAYTTPMSASSCQSYPPGLTIKGGALQGTPFAPGQYDLVCDTIYTLHILGSSTPRLDSVTNSGSYVLNQVAPGEIVALYGADLGPPVLSPTQLTADGKSFASTNGGTVVTINGSPVPIVYSLESQVAAIVPWELTPGTTASIAVQYNGATSNTLTAPVVAQQPGIFTLSGGGTGVAAAVNPDGTINSQSNPAPQGSTVLLYLTGTGQMSPAGVDGLIATAASGTLATPTAYVNGVPAGIAYAGNAPTLVEGATQVNLQLPASVAPGAAQVLLFFGTAEAQQAVTLWVK